MVVVTITVKHPISLPWTPNGRRLWESVEGRLSLEFTVYDEMAIWKPINYRDIPMDIAINSMIHWITEWSNLKNRISSLLLWLIHSWLNDSEMNDPINSWRFPFWTRLRLVQIWILIWMKCSRKLGAGAVFFCTANGWTADHGISGNGLEFPLVI